MELKDLRIFVCVPGVGKTYLANHDSRFVDLDKEKAKYKHKFDKNMTDYEMEKLKGHHSPDINEGSENYTINLLYEKLNEGKIILLAPNKQIVDLVNDNNLPYCLVYHNINCQEEYKQRMRNRGNQEDFIENMLGDEILKKYYKNSIEDTRPAAKIRMEKGEYLCNILWKIFGKN